MIALSELIISEAEFTQVNTILILTKHFKQMNEYINFQIISI